MKNMGKYGWQNSSVQQFTGMKMIENTTKRINPLNIKRIQCNKLQKEKEEISKNFAN